MTPRASDDLAGRVHGVSGGRGVEVKEVIRQWLGGAGKKRIAARLGLDVKTVRRYLAAAAEQGLRREPPPVDLEAAVAELVSALQAPGRPRSAGWTTCAAERGFIASKLASRARLSKIHKLLRRRGVQVKPAKRPGLSSAASSRR